jgi:hypothetical protein
MAASGDAGTPVAEGDGVLSDTFAALADAIATEIAPVLSAAGCTARLLERVEAALDEGTAKAG